MKNFAKYKTFVIVAIILIGLFLLSVDFQKDKFIEQKSSNVTKAASQDEKPSEQEAPLAPLFTLNDIDGKSVSLDDYKGKIVFVNFWATWCPPCRAEIPDFVRLIDKYGDKGFDILGISVDNPKDYKKIPGFMDQYKMNYTVLLDEIGQVNSMYGGIQSIPTTFVLDREGKALGRIIGARSFDQFEGILKQIL